LNHNGYILRFKNKKTHTKKQNNNQQAMQYKYQALKKLRRGINKRNITATGKNRKQTFPRKYLAKKRRVITATGKGVVKPFFRRYLAKKRRERIARAKKVALYRAPESIEDKLEMINKIFGSSVSLKQAMTLYQ
jgi:hypothetical protein